MALDPSAIGAVTEPQLYEWTERDTMLYALGVGAGTEDLSFTTENSHDIAQQVLPTFAVIPKRWVVERSISWLEKCRRLWKNCERKLVSSLAMMRLAFISLLLKRS